MHSALFFFALNVLKIKPNERKKNSFFNLIKINWKGKISELEKRGRFYFVEFPREIF